ncbi:MAG: M48 family metalloprotease [Proteobacteria bacterium]|nr:M48 family metalloprotease [Pseudomonadota bacterium]
MGNELIDLALRVNLALAGGIAIVLLLRALARRWFGTRIAYFLWLFPVLAAGACFLPPRIERLTIPAPLAPSLPSIAPAVASAPPAITHLPPIVWFAIWCAGALLSVTILAQRQGRFSRALGRLHPRKDLGDGVFGAESCTHGPAVIGVLRPIIVTPADFDRRFNDEERRIVLAHERAHLAQGDPLINALVGALQCVAWFNPLVHLGARALRLDQELAADAAVLATSARRPYAEAILKTQIMAAVPLGASWPPNSSQSLKERISMLKRTLPSRTQRLLGVSSIAVVAFGVCAAAWAAQPAHVVVTKTPHIARADAFIEPPVSDAAVLAGTPTSQQDAMAEYSKIDANSDQGAGDAADDNDDIDVADNSNQGDATDESASSNEGDTVISRHASDLSPEERARIRAPVRAAAEQGRAAAAEARAAARVAQSEAIREAVAQSRAAAEQGRAAAAQARIAARAAEVESVRASVAVAREMNSPRMQAEIRALAAQAAQLARSQAHLTAEQRDEIRAEIRARAGRLRDLAREHLCTSGHSDHQSHDDNTENN